MKRLQSLSYKTLFAILFFSLAGIVFFLKIGGKTQKVSAAWWDEMWHYRKAIYLTNYGANQTNTQIKLLTNYDLSSLVASNKLQTDLDDIRFTDVNGNLMKFWIEDATNNSADIWVVVPSLVSQTTILMYYGNSTAQSGETIMGLTSDNPGISCKAIQLSGGFSDRIYYIDPDGLEPTNAYKTYCDMTNDSGGWTLMMKAEGNTATFDYNATYWTTNNTLNPNDADINQNTDAKFESFNSLQINQIRATWPQTGHKMIETVSLITPLTLFQTTVDLGPTMVQFDYTNFPYQTGYQSYGFNLTCAAAVKVRWGWMFNNETTCSSNDCSAGIGMMNSYSTTNGGYVGCCSNKPTGGYPYRVRIWGRETNVVAPNISFLSTSLQSEESGGGPVAYWKFDEGVGTTAYDSTGANNGVFGTGSSSPNWADESQCISGKCLSFDGVNDYLSISNVNFSLTSGFTVSFWIKPLTYSNTRMPLSFRDSSSNWFRFFQDSSNNTGGTFETDQSPGEIGNKRTKINNNEWQHIVITWNGTNLNTFRNGIVYENSTPTLFTFGSFTTLYLGSYNGQNYFYNGLLDDIKFYSYARTADQIKQDYNSRGSISGSSVNLGVQSNTAPSIKSSLVAYYKFDENNGTSAYDSSGNNITGTFSGTTLPAWSQGKNNYGVNFNGVNNYIDLGNSSPIRNFTDQITVSVWAKYNAYGGGGQSYSVLAVKGTPWTFLMENPSNKIRFRVTVGGQDLAASDSQTHNLNQWYHFVGTYDGQNIKIYKNGILSGTTPATGSLGINDVSAKIGTYTGSTYNFNGIIDEVKIYNRALTAEEIKQDYNAGSAIQFGSTSQSIGGTTTSLEYCIPGDTSYCAPPIAEWKMDEGVGTSIVDTSGNNNTGTLVNSPTWVQGKIGKAGNFNGTNNYIDAGTSPSLNFGTGNFTVEFWINYKGPTTINGLFGSIVQKDNGPTSNPGFTSGITTYGGNGSNYGIIFSTTNGAWGDGNVEHAGAYNPNTWYHVTGVRNGNTFTIYKNGNYGISSTKAGVSVDVNNNQSLKIGGSTWGHINALIDHVKIYNYARTPAQIAYDYNKGGPVGWWKFDECQGNTAYDWSGNQNNGTITVGASGSQNSLGTCAVGTSAAWTNGATGKINSSLNFDGVDDYVDISSGFGVLSNYTIAFWAKHNVMDKMPISSKTNTNFYWYGDNSWRYVHGGVGGEFYYPKKVNIPYGTWGHFIVTYDGTKVSVYRNGIYEGSQNTSGTADFNNGFSLAKWVGGASYQFYGQIDDVRIYNYALTEEQIKQVYNGGAVNFR